MDQQFVIAHSPHIRDNNSVTRVMLDVLIALLPATVAAVYFFGFQQLITIVLCVGACIVTEALIQFLCKKPVTISDLSAAVTGLLLALNLPPNAPWYIPVVGGIFAIAICKQCFGGLGHNFVNPALAARAMLLTAWPLAMTTFIDPVTDGVSAATPLALVKAGETASLPSALDMFFGNTAGSMGETCAIAILLGAAYLLIRRVIHIRIPAAFLLSTAVFLLIFQGPDLLLEHMLSGGLLLGAFFMATDYVTTPVTVGGQIAFGIGCGLLVAVIRTFGGYPEGVCFSILLMNLVSPLLERAFKPKLYGEVKAK